MLPAEFQTLCVPLKHEAASTINISWAKIYSVAALLHKTPLGTGKPSVEVCRHAKQTENFGVKRTTENSTGTRAMKRSTPLPWLSKCSGGPMHHGHVNQKGCHIVNKGAHSLTMEHHGIMVYFTQKQLWFTPSLSSLNKRRIEGVNEVWLTSAWAWSRVHGSVSVLFENSRFHTLDTIYGADLTSALLYRTDSH